MDSRAREFVFVLKRPAKAVPEVTKNQADGVMLQDLNKKLLLSLNFEGVECGICALICMSV